ncbi:MAG: YceI family protein [Deltaproteobacteria bacterium]|nr:YceI family protein [Deltaproteobacteria bacterium]
MANWVIDNSHSHIDFSVRHMVFAKVRGAFRKWNAQLALAEDLASSTVNVEVEVASIDTGEEKRDGHLRSADFFDAETHPKMTFASKRIDKTQGTLLVVGDLTIHGVTKEVALDVEETGRGKDPWGNERVGFSAKTSINRADYGLTWNAALETGGVLVGEKVEISIEVEAVKQA